jgi:hypothetical protein
MPTFAVRSLWLVVAFGLGAVALWSFERRGRPAPPDGPTIITRMREVARLEALEVTVYKKIAFEPGPEPADSVWGDLFNFVRFTLRAPKGRAIVFARLHLGLDLSKLDVERVAVRGDSVEVVLPPTEVKVELLPGETEVIASNLDSAQTAKLLELAKDAFEAEARADRPLQEKARLSAERAIRALLITLGFRQVSFVSRLSQPGGPA